MNKYNNYFEEIYGKGTEMTVTTETGETISGMMYGNDECFVLNEFFQILVSGEKVYRCFYCLDQFRQSDDYWDLGNIDYEHSYRVEECTSEYEDEVE